MSQYTKEQIEKMKALVVGKKIMELEYDEEEDYYVMVFKDTSEISFRFMSDLFLSEKQ